MMIILKISIKYNIKDNENSHIYIYIAYHFSLESRPDILILHIKIVPYFNEKLHIIVVEA